MRRYVYGSIVACSLAGGAPGCTSSQTSTAVTAPAVAKCQVQVGSTTTSFTADGGRGTLSIATTRDCVWSITTDAGWVSMTGSGGQGDASVPYTVAANPVAVSRVAAINVSDASLQLNQAAAPCRYALSQSGTTIGAAGGSLSVQMNATTGCSWTAASDVAWVSVTSGASGSGVDTIGITIAANSGVARVGHVQAGGQVYTVSQTAASAPAPAPTPTPTPPPAPPPPQTTQLSGTLSGLSGKCPSVSFVVSSKTVTTSGATAFTGNACKDLKNGRSTSVTGAVQLNGTVLAAIVDQD
jgi:hypothetical protein